jgi:hypothetical protein
MTDAIALLEPLVGKGVDLAARPALMAAGGQLARAYMLQTDMVNAIAAADRVLPVAERNNRPAEIADLLITKGTALGFAGRVREGLALVRAGEEVAAAAGATMVVLRSLTNRAGSLEWISMREAYESSRRGMAIGYRVGHRAFTLTLLANAALEAVYVGDWDWAAGELANQPYDDFSGIDRMLGQTYVGHLRALRGEPREDLMADLVQVKNPEVLVQSEVDRTLGLDALAEGRVAEARTHIRAALATQYGFGEAMWSFRTGLWLRDEGMVAHDLDELDASGVHGEGSAALRLTMAAGLAGLRGSTDEALGFYRRAAEAWRDQQLPFLEALLGVDMATVLDPALPEVAAAVATSREILTRLKAAPFIARLDELTGGVPPADATEPQSEPAAMSTSAVPAE